MTPDAINAAFELLGAAFVWMNAYVLWRDFEIKGVYWPGQIFFTLWGFWNLYYYPGLDQWLSFYAGIVLVTGNVLWSYMAIKIRYFKKMKIETIVTVKHNIEMDAEQLAWLKSVMKSPFYENECEANRTNREAFFKLCEGAQLNVARGGGFIHSPPVIVHPVNLNVADYEAPSV